MTHFMLQATWVSSRVDLSQYPNHHPCIVLRTLHTESTQFHTVLITLQGFSTRGSFLTHTRVAILLFANQAPLFLFFYHSTPPSSSLSTLFLTKPCPVKSKNRIICLYYFHSPNQLSQWRAALIFWTVQEMRLFTVSTDSTVSFAVGKLFTRIWKATVRRDPLIRFGPPLFGPLDPGPSGTMANPDGRSAT